MKLASFSINRALILFIGIIIFLAVTNFSVIRFFKSTQEMDALVINSAGRNRALSQQIGLFAQIYMGGNERALEKLKATVSVHDKSLGALKAGGIVPGIGKGEPIPQAEEEILPVIEMVETFWEDYRTNAYAIIKKPPEDPLAIQSLQYIQEHAEEMLSKNNELVIAFVNKSADKQKTLDVILIVLLLANISFGVLAYFLTQGVISKPIGSLKQAAQDVSKGLDHNLLDKYSDPDLSSIADSISAMATNIDEAAKFSENIGKGQFDHSFDESLKGNRLFDELSSMRLKLMEVAAKDQKRNWITKGLAEFGEVLRANHNDIKKLSNDIISKMVKYLNANQGSIFILNDDGDEYMELNACYAWERKKYLEKRFEKGQGLVGQCWLEKEMIYMTQIPDNYVKITSGLGSANPNALLIIPLMVNEEIFGIIEIASFNSFEPHQIDFIKKVSENIASTLSSAKISSRTKNLLNESQQQTEEMRAQEEEMRQNMEELQATQESIARNENRTKAILEAIQQAIVVIDVNGMITTVNQTTCTLFDYKEDEMIGRNISMLISTEHSSQYDDVLDYFFQGREHILTGKMKDSNTFKIKISSQKAQVEGENMFVGLISKVETEAHISFE
ncbi:MAG: GAF domain-containing protein [Bacteroidota bacterium]